MDITRTAIRHGARKVTCFSLNETAAANQYEFSYAQLEGVDFEYNKNLVVHKQRGPLYFFTDEVILSSCRFRNQQ